MSINYEDSGLLVNYIQMFLKQYYSKFIDIKYYYSKEIQDHIIDYINSPDSVTMREMSSSVLPKYNDYSDLLQFFNKEERIDEIYFESRLTNKELNNLDSDMPYYRNSNNDNNDGKPPVNWIHDNLEGERNFESYISKYGWKVENYNYNNKNNKCDITIKKMNENVLPKLALIDLINLFDTKHTETCLSIRKTTGNQLHYFSSLYDIEIKNYELKNDKNDEYEIRIPTFNDYETKYDKFNHEEVIFNPYFKIIRKSNGIYEVHENNEENKLIIPNFRGFKTFSSNIISFREVESEQYYVIYFKKPKIENIIKSISEDADKIISEDVKESISDLSNYIYVNLSNVSNESSNKELEEIGNIDNIMINLDKELYNYYRNDPNISDEYYIILVKIPYSKKDYNKLCLSIYDPNDEIDTILSFKLDSKYVALSAINNNYPFRNNDFCIAPLEDKAYLENLYLYPSFIIDPYSYYSSPYKLHNKFITYILEQIIHEYSREEDIILIQKELNKIGFGYDNTEFGEYTQRLREFVSDLQSSGRGKNGNQLLYGNGYVDPDTEAIIKLRGVGDFNG